MTDIAKKVDRDGFIVLKNAIPHELVHEARELTKEIIDYFEDDHHKDPFKNHLHRHRVDNGALYDLYFRHPEFQKLASHSNVVGALKEIIGENLFMYENTLVYKPKGKNNEVPWHQDFMDRKDEPTKYVIWVALDDVTVENGALKFIPGSHKNGFLPWFKVKGETHHTRLKLDGVDLDSYEHGIMNAGDVLIFHHLVIHGSDRVSVNQPRRAYRFSAQGFSEIYSPRCVPVVLSGGRPSSYINSKPKTNNKPVYKRLINSLGKKMAKY